MTFSLLHAADFAGKLLKIIPPLKAGRPVEVIQDELRRQAAAFLEPGATQAELSVVR